MLSLAALTACPADDAAPSDSDSAGAQTDPREQCERFYEHYGECTDYEFDLEEECGGTDSMDPCVRALTEIFACMSTLDCADIPAANGCSDAFERANELCPSEFGACLSEVSSGGELCESESTDCFDGNEYTLSCSEDEGVKTCVCLTNGAEVGSFNTDDASCEAEGLAEATRTECGWPEGVPTPY